jgi:hypothetical protein
MTDISSGVKVGVVDDGICFSVDREGQCLSCVWAIVRGDVLVNQDLLMRGSLRTVALEKNGDYNLRVQLNLGSGERIRLSGAFSFPQGTLRLQEEVSG